MSTQKFIWNFALLSCPGGYAPWENVWGVWNGLSDRDAEALRRVAHFDRFFADRVAGGEFLHFAGDLDLPPGVFASRAGGDLWLVKRGCGGGC